MKPKSFAILGTFVLLSLAAMIITSLPSSAMVTETPSTTIAVWPDLAPGETTKVTDVDKQNITSAQMLLFPAPGAGAHPAVLVSPGGGYSHLALAKEGTDIAQWLNTLGFTAAVLEYRIPGNREGAFQDGQRAMRDLRYNAKQYGIDPKRLGVMGFSAGGHLSARLSTQYDVQSYTPIDAVDKESARPDFAVLVYPAYLVDKKTKGIATEVAPHAGMPPFFVTQTLDDPFLDAPAYAAALQVAGIPVKAVIYPTGHHGYGMRLPDTVAAHAWPQEAAKWLIVTEHP